MGGDRGSCPAPELPPSSDQELNGMVPLVAGEPCEPHANVRAAQSRIKVKQTSPASASQSSRAGRGHRSLPSQDKHRAKAAVTLPVYFPSRGQVCREGRKLFTQRRSAAPASLILPRQHRLLPAACLCINCRGKASTDSILSRVKAW